MASNRIFRNTFALLASQPLTWALTLFFTLLVPRNVGPGEWGEWTIASSIGQLAIIVLDLGANMVLVKGMARYPQDSERALGTVLTLRLLLAPVLVAAMVGFGVLAGYSQHTHLLVTVTALGFAVTYVATPAGFGLQALERMHFSAFSNVLIGLILTAGAFLIVKIFALGIISIGLLAIVARLVGMVILLVGLGRSVRIRLILDLELIKQFVREGLPYWATGGFLTVYTWLDGVLLSLFANTQENGWYGVATRTVATSGFLLLAVTSAVFPSLSRGLAGESDEAATLAERSFRLLITFSLPMAAGMALISGNLVTFIYGGWFAPAGPALLVLAITIPAVFIATLVNTFLVAADRQLQWTGVMAGICGLNLILNLFTIPFFHAHFANGALGAALALLVTDIVSGVIAVVLVPTKLRPSMRAALPSILAAVPATLLMAAVVWPLRDLFLPIPIAAGAVTFGIASLLLRVFPQDELELLTTTFKRLVLGTRRAAAMPGVQQAGPTETLSVPTEAVRPDDARDAEVA